MNRTVFAQSLFSPQSCFKPGIFRCFFSTNVVSNGARYGKSRFEFGNINGPNDALILYRTMIDTTPFPDVKLFNGLLSRTVKIKEYSVASSLFSDISIKGKIPVNSYTLNIMTNCYCNFDRVDLGFSMLCSFFKRDYRPDQFTFSPLLKALLRQRKIAESDELFRNIGRQKLCHLVHLPFSSQFCSRELQLSIANTWEKMDYYDSVINGLCKDRKLDTARELLDSLPNLHRETYNAVIKECCENGLLEDAKDVLATMERKWCFPNAITYNTIIRGMLEGNEFDDANKFLDLMTRKGFSPDASTTCLMSDLFESGEDNHTLFDMMETCGLHYWPTLVVASDTWTFIMY